MSTKFRDFQPGTRVRLSGKFLRSTGQLAGGEGRKVWAVLDIETAAHWIVVDEPACTDRYTAAELGKEPSLAFRRIAKANLVIVGQTDARDS